MAHTAHLRARPHDQRRGDRGRRAGLLLPRKPVRHRHTRELQGVRGELAVAARGDVQARQPPREGLREARRGGAPWLNRSHPASPSRACSTGTRRPEATTPSRGSPSAR